MPFRSCNSFKSLFKIRVGFDLTQVIPAMIRNRRLEGKGALSCKGTDPSTNHSDIVYEVAIQYT
jgi:hypothetical protein